MRAFWFKAHFWLSFVALKRLFSFSDSLYNCFKAHMKCAFHNVFIFIFACSNIYNFIQECILWSLLLLHALNSQNWETCDNNIASTVIHIYAWELSGNLHLIANQTNFLFLEGFQLCGTILQKCPCLFNGMLCF